MSFVEPEPPGPLDEPSRWSECSTEGCRGAIVLDGACLAHVDEMRIDAAVTKMLSQGAVDLRGTSIEPQLINHILSRAPYDGDRPVLPHVLFDDAHLLGRVSFGEAWYSGAVIRGVASFQRTHFASRAAFIGVQFLGDVSFVGAVFDGEAQFDGNATFHRNADFSNMQAHGWFSTIANFDGMAFFENATLKDVSLRGTFNSHITFREAQFTGPFSADKVTFRNGLDFTETTFMKSLSLKDVSIGGRTVEPALMRLAAYLRGTSASSLPVGETEGADTSQVAICLNRAKISGPLSIIDTLVDGSADLQGAILDGTGSLSGLTVVGDLDLSSADFDGIGLGAVAVIRTVNLDGTSFQTRVDGAVDASRLYARSTRLVAGGRLRIRRANVWLDGTSFPSPFLLTSLEDDDPPLPRRAPIPPPPSALQENSGSPDSSVAGEDPSVSSPPSGGANGSASAPAEEATSSGQPTDGMEEIDWPKANGLPRLRSIHGADVTGLSIGDVDLRSCRFTGAQNLDKLRLQSLESLPRARSFFGAGGRRLLAEEIAVRHKHGKTLEAAQHDLDPKEISSLNPTMVAATYRALRKGVEDVKNEPGAADLYYGEMEMRRMAAKVGTAEWWVLTFYWLSSGYGLRASRALILLVLTTLCLTVMFVTVGFLQPVPIGRALTYSAGSAVSVTSTPDLPLSTWGEVFRIILRIAGPLFLGLAVLSLRGRIKR
jgi:uncharacterized protein YjbI with pentapeptide repeats